MNMPDRFVSLHPYFKVLPGKLNEFKAALPGFVQATATETKNLFYDFTVNEDEVFCREGYDGAEALLTHLEYVVRYAGRGFQDRGLNRLEVHGPAGELEKLRSPLAHLKPAWFVRVA